MAVTAVIWVLAVLGLAWRLAADANNYVSGPCEVPGHDSQYGTATWALWPPGETCRDDGGRVFRRPSTQRSVLLVAVAAGVVGIPAMTWGLVRADRARRPPDSAFDELLRADSRAE